MRKLTTDQRSYIMSRVRKKDTRPEMIVRRYLFHQGFRFRLHVSKLPGTPDIVLPKFKTVIFVNGCFWHHHTGCALATLPEKRKEYWWPKILGNKDRDEVNQVLLNAMGWRVYVIYECELKKKIAQHTLNNLALSLVNDKWSDTRPFEAY